MTTMASVRHTTERDRSLGQVIETSNDLCQRRLTGTSWPDQHQLAHRVRPLETHAEEQAGWRPDR